MADGTTIGVWIGEDDAELVDEFDELFGMKPNYSRSKEVKRAMRTHITIELALREVGVEEEIEPRERQHLLRQAILDLYRGE